MEQIVSCKKTFIPSKFNKTENLKIKKSNWKKYVTEYVVYQTHEVEKFFIDKKVDYCF